MLLQIKCKNFKAIKQIVLELSLPGCKKSLWRKISLWTYSFFTLYLPIFPNFVLSFSESRTLREFNKLFGNFELSLFENNVGK